MAEDQATKPEKNEIATTRDGKDITRGFTDSLPLLQTQDKLLLLKGGGSLKIYQEVLRDEQVKACLAQRFSAVTSCAWKVQPGGEKLIDKKAAEFIEQQLNNLKFDDITEKMLYGVFYGYAVAEVIWSIDGNRVVIADIKVRDRVRFGFAPDMSLRLKTMQKPDGEILPERKFWHFATGADHHDEPYGLGLAHWLYWPVFFKRSGIKFWMKFLEKFGTPTAHGKYESGTIEEEQNKLLNALRDMQNDSAVITPDGMVIELLEAKRSGAADYKSMVEVMDNAIAKVILGQTASTQGTPGRLGNDDLQSDVRQDIVKADGDLACMSFSATVAKWLTDWNFPGAAYPTVWREIEEPEDLDALSERISKITSAGFKPTLKYIQDAFGGEWVEKTTTAPDAANDPVQQRPGKLVAFAEPGESPTTQLENDLVENTNSGWQSAVNKLQKIVDNAKDLTGLQKQLISEFSELSDDSLVNIMTAGFALAELRGLSDVQDESAA